MNYILHYIPTGIPEQSIRYNKIKRVGGYPLIEQLTSQSSSQGEFHPKALTEPYVNLSTHPCVAPHIDVLHYANVKQNFTSLRFQVSSGSPTSSSDSASRRTPLPPALCLARLTPHLGLVSLRLRPCRTHPKRGKKRIFAFYL